MASVLPRKKASAISWKGCSIVRCLNSVCFEPEASIPIGPASFVVSSGIACANLLSVVLPFSSVTYASSHAMLLRASTRLEAPREFASGDHLAEMARRL